MKQFALVMCNVIGFPMMLAALVAACGVLGKVWGPIGLVYAAAFIVCGYLLMKVGDNA